MDEAELMVKLVDLQDKIEAMEKLEYDAAIIIEKERVKPDNDFLIDLAERFLLSYADKTEKLLMQESDILDKLLALKPI